MRRSTYWSTSPGGVGSQESSDPAQSILKLLNSPSCPPHPTAQDVLLGTWKGGKCRPPGTQPLHLAVWLQSPYIHGLPSHQSLSALSRLTLQTPSKGGLGANAPWLALRLESCSVCCYHSAWHTTRKENHAAGEALQSPATYCVRLWASVSSFQKLGTSVSLPK